MSSQMPGKSVGAGVRTSSEHDQVLAVARLSDKRDMDSDQEESRAIEADLDR